MSYKDKIAGAFGVGDYKFASHQSETINAADLLKRCVEERVNLNDLLDDVENYLDSEKVDRSLINEEIDKVREMFSPWLE